MKKLFVFIFAILLVNISTIEVFAEENESLYIQKLIVNSYEIPISGDKNLIGLEVPHDNVNIMISVVPSIKGASVTGTGFLPLLKDEEAFEIHLKNGEEEKTYKLIVVRAKAPSKEEQIKSKLKTAYEVIYPALVIVPIAVIVMVLALPDDDNKKTRN